MPTINQLVKNKRLSKKINLKKTPALYSNPQKQGTCISVFIKTPRKPNSALRKVAKVRLVNSRIITVYIPGEGHNISRFSDVIVSGRRIRDLPGVKYGALRGKLDLCSVNLKKNGRSKYGTKKEKKDFLIKNKDNLKEKKTKIYKRRHFYYKIFCKAYHFLIFSKTSIPLSEWMTKTYWLFRIGFLIYKIRQLHKKGKNRYQNICNFINYLRINIKKKKKLKKKKNISKRRKYQILYISKVLLAVKDIDSGRVYYYDMELC